MSHLDLRGQSQRKHFPFEHVVTDNNAHMDPDVNDGGASQRRVIKRKQLPCRSLDTKPWPFDLSCKSFLHPRRYRSKITPSEGGILLPPRTHNQIEVLQRYPSRTFMRSWCYDLSDNPNSYPSAWHLAKGMFVVTLNCPPSKGLLLLHLPMQSNVCRHHQVCTMDNYDVNGRVEDE